MRLNNNLIQVYNSKYRDDIKGFLMQMKNMRVRDDKYYHEINVPTEDNVSFEWKGTAYQIKSDCGFGLIVGELYTPFEMLVAVKFKGEDVRALWYVIYDLLNEDVPYVRVGYKFYKIILKPDRFEVARREMKVWEKATLVDDYGKPFLGKIPKFDDFTIEPDNKKFKQVIGNNFNLYSPFEHTEVSPAKMDRKAFPWTERLLKHIFGSEEADWEKGCRYMKVLYDHPRQVLPILVLTSQERQTGKSTFIDWFNILFGANCVVINPQDIGSDFNSAYTDKNVIAIEESKFDRASTLEKIKALATQKMINVNAKHIQQYKLPFFGKLIITSNNEEKFSRVDDEEIRYWVRKIPTLKGTANHNILEDLRNEIPQFLAFLSSLPDVDLTKSRMVFTADEIATEALTNVKKESFSEVHKETESYLDTHCMNNTKVEFIDFCAKDIKEKIFHYNSNFGVHYIGKVIAKEMKLNKPYNKPHKYIPLETDGNSHESKINGRHFRISNPYFVAVENVVDENPDDLPF